MHGPQHLDATRALTNLKLEEEVTNRANKTSEKAILVGKAIYI